LLLKYDDGSGAIVEENIMPGASFTKTFSVTNEGNAKIDNYVVYLEEVVNDLKRPQDLTYTLTCDNCSGSEGEYPKLAGIIATNSIEVGETHNYTLTVTYENLPNTDQSIDMGSRISGYIQIYNLQDIVDLTGSVTNAVDGDYVQINSVQKISQIVDGKYTLGAIEPGNHTITVRYIDENDEEQIRSTKTITIQKGETASVSGDTITVTNDSQTVNINIDATNADNTTISSTIKDYNPYEGILAFTYANGKKIDITTSESIDDSEIKTKAIEYPFSITNISEEHQKITISLKNIEIDAALKDIDFRWGLYNADTDVGLSFGIFKNIDTETTIYEDIVIDAGESARNYKLRIWIHDDGASQDYLYNKKFSAKITIDGEGVEYTPEECFSFSNGTITDYDVSCGGTDVIIPKTINNTDVTTIGGHGVAPVYGAFESKGLTSLVIPQTITQFTTNDDYYFFSDNDLTNLTIPASITVIGNNDFASIDNLVTVRIPESITSIGANAFYYSVSIKELVIPGSVNSIENAAFSGHIYGDLEEENAGQITDIVLMDGVKTIASDAFTGHQYSEIEIPSSVTTLKGGNGGPFRFYINYVGDIYSPNFTKIVVRGKTSVSDFADASGLTGEYALPEGVTIEYRQ